MALLWQSFQSVIRDDVTNCMLARLQPSRQLASKSKLSEHSRGNSWQTPAQIANTSLRRRTLWAAWISCSAWGRRRCRWGEPIHGENSPCQETTKICWLPNSNSWSSHKRQKGQKTCPDNEQCATSTNAVLACQDWRATSTWSWWAPTTLAKRIVMTLDGSSCSWRWRSGWSRWTAIRSEFLNPSYEDADWSCPPPQWGINGSRYCSSSSRSSSLWRWCSPGKLHIFLNVSTARLRLIRWSLASSRNNVYSS